MSRSAPQTSPVSRPVDRPVRPKSAGQAKARAKARKAKKPKVVRPPLRERLLDPAGVDRPAAAHPGGQGPVRGVGDRFARRRPRLSRCGCPPTRRSARISLAAPGSGPSCCSSRKKRSNGTCRKPSPRRHLAEAARGLGMIPTRDTAHLVKDPAGNWVVVGTPKPAQGVPPPPLNTKLPDEKPVPPAATPGNPVRGAVAACCPATVLRPFRWRPVPTSWSAPRTARPRWAHSTFPHLMPRFRCPEQAGTVQPVPGVQIAPGPVPGRHGAAAGRRACPAAAGPAAARRACTAGSRSVPPPAVDVPHHLAPVAPLNGEQFGPLTVTAPGAAR